MTRLPVLTYHALADVQSPLAVPPSRFAQTMTRLAREGWRTLGEREVQAGLREGRWPDRSFVVHFDDGFGSVRTHAWPVLRDLGFTATIFVVSGWVGRTNGWPTQPADMPRWPLMTWDDLEELVGGGATLAAHTVNHPRLSQLSSTEQADEIGRSVEIVESRVGPGVRAFAFPYGDTSPAVRRVASPLVDLAYTTHLSLVPAGADALSLPRVDACYLATPAMAAAVAEPPMRGYLAVRRAGRLLRRALTG